MTIELRCRQCDLQYRVPDHAAGKRIQCRKCQRLLRVPATPNESGTALDPAPGAHESAEELRDRLLFGEQEAGDDQAASKSSPVTPHPRRQLPPKDLPAEPARKSPRRQSRTVRSQVGGSTKDKLTFAAGVLFVLGALAWFAPILLYAIGILFFWLAYLWIAGDAYEQGGYESVSTGAFHLLFHFLTHPLHLWPAIVFMALGVICELLARGELHFY